MKNVPVADVVPVIVVSNRVTRKTAWARIRHAKTGKVLHVGKPRYIERIARERYGKIVTL